MNGQDRDALAKFEIRLGNVEKQLEKLVSEDTGSLYQRIDAVESKVDRNTGKLTLLVPLSVATFVAVIFGMMAMFFLG